mgnify:CR=1 FL=1
MGLSFTGESSCFFQPIVWRRGFSNLPDAYRLAGRLMSGIEKGRSRDCQSPRYLAHGIHRHGGWRAAGMCAAALTVRLPIVDLTRLPKGEPG